MEESGYDQLQRRGSIIRTPSENRNPVGTQRSLSVGQAPITIEAIYISGEENKCKNGIKNQKKIKNQQP